MKSYFIVFICVLLFCCSCSSVCRKTIGREQLEIDKKDLVCSCNDLERDTVLSQKIWEIEKGSARYLVGHVLINKEEKGIYQYVKTGSGIRGNMFMYYNGSQVRLLNKDNLKNYADSAIAAGVDERKMKEMLPAIQKSMDKPAVNTTDSF
jgi:hypothetical protein